MVNGTNPSEHDDHESADADVETSTPSSAEPANTLLPLGSFTERELQVLVPSLARKPSIVI